jgi:hypothetical protein
VALQKDANGTSRHFSAMQYFGALGANGHHPFAEAGWIGRK